jgi:hypothetical protein
MWIELKNNTKDLGEYVLTICPRMGRNGKTMIIVAKLITENE